MNGVRTPFYARVDRMLLAGLGCSLPAGSIFKRQTMFTWAIAWLMVRDKCDNGKYLLFAIVADVVMVSIVAIVAVQI